jgi:hypothetical protein
VKNSLGGSPLGIFGHLAAVELGLGRFVVRVRDLHLVQSPPHRPLSLLVLLVALIQVDRYLRESVFVERLVLSVNVHLAWGKASMALRNLTPVALASASWSGADQHFPGHLSTVQFVFAMMLCSTMLAVVLGARQEAIDTSLAARAFKQAEELSAKDGGRLWGIPLYGPMFFADRQSHFIVANMSDPNGALTKRGDVYVGTLPQNISIANTAVEWSGRRWTMVAWPLPDLKYVRGRLLMHESFHRIQPALGFHIADLPSQHLDGEDGRTWMRLEIRALSEALTQTGSARAAAAKDALLFRDLRAQLCGPDAARSEEQLELNEGLAEYTGFKLSGMPSAAIPIRAAARLDQMESSDSFARSFAYVTGPAYGLILDTVSPTWRKLAVKGEPPDHILASALKFQAPADLREAAKSRLLAYDGDQVVAQETSREAAHEKRLAQYKEKFVDGPVLSFAPGENFGFSFDPNAVDSFPPLGSVYDGARVTDSWGVLEAGSADVLFVRDAAGLITEVRVAAPAVSEAPLSGDGWTLKLNSGWQLKPGARKGDWTIAKMAG